LHVAEAATILDEIASALIAAHDKGIIHRDLKPDNVFMVEVPGRWPEVRILDWGLLKLSSAQSSISSGRYRTLAGSVMGTPVYMSPEQARASESVDTRTDVYSLGIMAYELLCGQVPFRKGSSIDTLLAHQEDPVPSLAKRCPALPEELVQLIEAMLGKTPDERPTLAAVRTVIKRLRGTKIPTMTAAGLQMPPGPSMPMSDPAISLTPSMQVTRPRVATPLPSSGSIPGSLSLSAFGTPQDQIQPGASQTTLAGVSMPTPTSSNPRQPMLTTPVPPSRASAPDLDVPARRSPLIWIVIAAIILVGAGVAVLLTT
jgi:serine/threonine-protein kinase